MRRWRVIEKISGCGALARQLRQLDVRLRYVPPEKFLRTAVEGYLENKREQRL